MNTAPATVQDATYELLDFADPTKTRRRRARLQFSDGKISEVISSNQPPTFYVTPGFMNGHVHWLMLGGSSLKEAVDLLESHPETMYATAIANARRTANIGITTVCDKGPPGHTMPPALLSRIKRAQMGGEPIPRTLASHWTLSSTGSFGEVFTRSVQTERELLSLLESLKQSGSDWVKVIAESELKENNSYQVTFPDELFLPLMQFANANRLRVAVHAKGKETIDACIRHRVLCLEHALQITTAQLTALEQNDMYLGLTLHGFEGRLLYANQHPEKLGFKHTAEYEMHQALETAKGVANFHGPGHAHHNVLFSSDAGSHSTPHASLREAYLMRRAGFAPEAVFRAATFNGYRMLGLDNKLGTLDCGFTADLIFWRTDPLELSVAAWTELEKEIAGVMLGGMWVSWR